MNPIRTTVALLASGAILYTAAHVAMPGYTAAATGMIGERLDAVFAADCETAPVACLQEKHRSLTRLANGVEEARANLRKGLSETAEAITSQRTLVGLNEMYLEQGRTLLVNQVSGPIRFAHVDYPDRDTFERQLELYFVEGQRLKAVLADSEAQRARLEKSHQTLLSRQTEIRATLSIIPSKIALARAETTFAEIESDIAAIDSVMLNAAAETSHVDTLLRTTAETAAANKKDTDTNAAFRSWLAAETPDQ